MGSRKAKQRQRQKSQQPSLRAQALTPSAGGDAAKPVPWPNERAEDVGIFARSARMTLSAELQAEAALVSDALDMIGRGESEPALESLKPIGRSSPYADWRLFARGLVAFYASDFSGAMESWRRLEADRRPSRMASALLVAEGQSSLIEGISADSPTVTRAKQWLFRLPMVDGARRIANLGGGKDKFKPLQCSELLHWYQTYRHTDPEFALQFAQACTVLSVFQPQTSIFSQLKERIPGPSHDPRWHLLESHYWDRFEKQESRVIGVLQKYIDVDLRLSDKVSEPLKRAILSVVLVRLADFADLDEVGSMMYLIRGPSRRAVAQRKNMYGAAISAYPANRLAYKELLDTYEHELNTMTSSRAEEKTVEEARFQVLAKLVSQFPDEVVAGLELIDHYFEDGRLAEARDLAERLQSQRIDDPRGKSLPWKLTMLESFAASRRKTMTTLVLDGLDRAEAIWPDWVGREWLPYLRAAVAMRAGDEAAFRALLEKAIRETQSPKLLADLMTFAALRRLEVPAAILKPYRESLDSQLKAIKKQTTHDLLLLAAFMWDLYRSGLGYPGLRNHQSIVVRELERRKAHQEQIPVTPAVEKGYCLLFRLSGDAIYKPDSFLPKEQWSSRPRYLLAHLMRLLEARHSSFRIPQLVDMAQPLREAMKSERDGYYRFHMESILSQLEKLAAESKSVNDFFHAFNFNDEDEDEEADDDQFDTEDYFDEVDEDDEDEEVDGDDDQDDEDDDELFGRYAADAPVGGTTRRFDDPSDSPYVEPPANQSRPRTARPNTVPLSPEERKSRDKELKRFLGKGKKKRR